MNYPFLTELIIFYLMDYRTKTLFRESRAAGKKLNKNT